MNAEDTTPFEQLSIRLVAARAAYKELGRSLLAPLFETYFAESPENSKIVILGWTPGFNDGDPCVHEMSVLLDPADFADHGMEDELDEGVVVPEYGSPGYPKYNTPEYKVREAKRDAFGVFFDTLNDVYGTNWKLTVSLDETGSVSIKEDEYDCGH